VSSQDSLLYLQSLQYSFRVIEEPNVLEHGNICSLEKVLFEFGRTK